MEGELCAGADGTGNPGMPNGRREACVAEKMEVVLLVGI